MKNINRLNDYLEGPGSRFSEFKFTFKVMRQFIKGFRKLHFVGPCITVFGSARFRDDHKYYRLAYEVGKEISRFGFTVMTGGGPGIMEAANKGAFDQGGKSVGCNIILPHEQNPNPYMDTWVEFDHFFVRKVLLLKYSYAFFVLPGGWGTMDELFETLTLIQTGILKNFPVVVMGKEYFQQLNQYLDFMIEEGTISRTDLELILFTDSVDEAFDHLSHYLEINYKLKMRRKRMWVLGE
ncbi:TIGR00730 family Rossman fold protein [Membranihabitans maritimus]|uniref:LOG family protein n=1 Tax=Membranihabitans maritimus TaxID=2904244 RepID=UPI001F22A91E|nr:TIGR00730 family Rossman fold protein [Membranihabitans maritimus]